MLRHTPLIVSLHRFPTQARRRIRPKKTEVGKLSDCTRCYISKCKSSYTGIVSNLPFLHVCQHMLMHVYAHTYILQDASFLSLSLPQAPWLTHVSTPPPSHCLSNKKKIRKLSHSLMEGPQCIAAIQSIINIQEIHQLLYINPLSHRLCWCPVSPFSPFSLLLSIKIPLFFSPW